MTERHCRRIAALSARADIDDLDARERETLNQHLEGCERCREHAAVRAALRARLRGEPVPDGQSDQAIIGRAILQTGRFPSSAPDRRRRAPWIAAAAVALLAAGIGGWLLLRGDGEPAVAESESAPAAEHAGSAQSAQSAPAEPTDSSGGDAALAAGPGAQELCPGVRARVQGEGRLTRSTERRCAIDLAAGALWMHVDPAQRSHVTIATPHAEVVVRGTVFGVEVHETETEVTVERGRVEVRRGEDRTQVERDQRAVAGADRLETDAGDDSLESLHALTESLALPEPETTRTAANGPSPARRVADLRRLLGTESPARVRHRVMGEMADPALAQRRAELWTIVAETHLAEGAHAEALEAYGRVWRGPRSATAANALIAGGDVALDRLGQATRARGLYERYLAEYPSGSLREVAEAGRCRAMAVGGRAAAVHRCVEGYRERFAEGRFRRQLDALLD
jgi:tetratricopeptide (TPR) repeat protein